MAWAERTFDNTIQDVGTPGPPGQEERETENNLRGIFKDMPPFIKLTSRRARKTLARYETLKQRHIEMLRENNVFKFVMLVAGLTNERMETYWKGNSVDPFSDKTVPMNTKLTKGDLKLVKQRAKERAFADLHQFCGPLKAVPTHRRAIVGTRDKLKSRVKYIYNMSDTEFEKFIEIFLSKGFPGPDNMRWYVLGRDVELRKHNEDNREPPFPSHDHFRGQEYPGDPVNPNARTRTKTRPGARVYPFESAIGTVQGALGAVAAAPWGLEGIPGNRNDRNNQPAERWYDDVTGRGEVPWGERRGNGRALRYPIEPRRPPHHSRDRIYDHRRIFDDNGRQVDSYDHRDEYVTLKRSDWWEWSKNMPIVRWETDRPEFWFQRYVARWLSRETEDIGRTGGPDFDDLRSFRNKYQGTFNNLKFDEERQVWYRDLTGLRLTKMLREADQDEDGEPQAENEEGENDEIYPSEPLYEVPLDFVKPLFNERYAHWKHELVLGEYERRAMYQADQWLQKTPWAIGKIYLQPSMFAHMQEAHIAICAKHKKFEHLRLQDWLSSEKHRYFLGKLVALCIRTSAVLSNKRYGLDKVYLRLNLEKRRVMYAIAKLPVPARVAAGAVAFPRAPQRQRDDWNRYAAARRAGDAGAAANALRDMNKN